MLSAQVPLPVQAPLQPEKTAPAAGVATSVTVASALKLALQVPGQLMPPGDDVTVPEPVTVVVRTLLVSGGVTVTVADAWAVPPAPVQASVKVLVAVSALLDWMPAVARVPDHAPEATQLAAFFADQVRVVAAPLVTLAGLAVSATVGVGVAMHSKGSFTVPRSVLMVTRR
jgi:hypothetical protein